MNSFAPCAACGHDRPHNVFGRCATPACSCHTYLPDDGATPVNPAPPGTTMVVRNEAGDAIAVPDEVIAAAEKPFRAYKAHRDGCSWEEVAAAENYPSARAASEAVARYLCEGAAIVGEMSRNAARAVELDRLRVQTKQLWPTMMAGSIPAHLALLQISKHRAAICRWTDPEADNTDEFGTGAQVTTVVVQSATYREDLQRLAGVELDQAPVAWRFVFDDNDIDSEPYREFTDMVANA